MKELKNFIHLYLGCEVKTTGGKTAKLVSVGLNLSIIVYPDGHPIGNVISPASLKPILRRLSSMTEEEATDIAIIMYGQPDSVRWRMDDKRSYFNVYRKHYSESFTIDKASGDIDRYSKEGDQMELQTTLQHHFITHYMLSKHFDLFNLIDEGLAIDKDTLKT